MLKGKSSKKLLLGIAIPAFLSGMALAGGLPEEKIQPKEKHEQAPEKLQQTLIEAQRLLEELRTGPKDNVFTIYDHNDFILSVGAKTSIDSYLADNLVMLNKNIPDGISYFKQTVDFTGGLTYGKEKYGHEAIKVFGDLRAKGVWGDLGSACSTVSETIKLDGIDVVVGSHKHLNKKAYINLREAWLQFSLNSIANLNTTKLQFVKLGMFPFALGRGIALGTSYGTGKDYLGISSGYFSDQFAPGINVHGDILKNKLTYDFYYAKLEEQSDSISKTFNFIKANRTGRCNAWRGVSKDNDLVAARLQWTALDSKSKGKLNLEPYILYNEASDRTIEFAADAKSELGTAGLSLEYKNTNFEFGAESAFNFGQETAYAIDRNTTSIARQDDGTVIVKYTKIVDGDNKTVAVTTANKTIVDASSNTTNGAQIGTGLYNSSDRFRPKYQTNYGGWMFVTDAAYRIQKAHLKLAAGYGYASGDVNPHQPYGSSEVEKDKTYNGFIGLQEFYTGKRVQSAFFLDARKLKRPLTSGDLELKEKPVGEDNSFTDMHYLGINATWFPIKENENKFSVAANILGYWKAIAGYKYDQVNDKATTDKAERYLGTECNLRLRYEMLKNLHAYGDFAVFVPGTYYQDIKGTPLSGDYYKKLNAQDQTGKNPADYRLGDDTAYYINVGLFYKF